MNDIKLGAKSAYPDKYSSKYLEPIERRLARVSLAGVNISDDASLPFTGVDVWTSFEVSWLDSSGKPVVAVGVFTFACTSKCIVESKSFKYYLNSFNQTRFHCESDVKATLQSDLTAVTGADVCVDLFSLDSANLHMPIGVLEGRCIDQCELVGEACEPSRELLRVLKSHVSSHAVFSHLLKSNCPVTNQPDWASVWIKYSGAEIDEMSLLAYVVSFRQHQGFHESCVERIFNDIQLQCKPKELTVYARYTRRGGLDINPFRTNCNELLPSVRLVRQ